MGQVCFECEGTPDYGPNHDDCAGLRGDPCRCECRDPLTPNEVMKLRMMLRVVSS
jgi:hypothetical protein